MGFFSRSKSTPPAPSTLLDQRVLTLETELKLLRTEWNDLYDKIAHQFDRLRKRQKAMIADQGTEPEETASPLTADAVWELARRKGMVQ